MDGSTLLAERGLTLGRGRRASPLSAEISRELTEEDIILAGTRRAVGTLANGTIQQLRQSHHMLARLLAQGIPDIEVSSISGFCISRISILKGDPTFGELVEYYKGMEAEAHKNARADMHERLAAIGFDSIEMLHERLHSDPDSFDNSMLLKITEASADRTGFGKTSTVNHDHSVSLSPRTLAEIRTAATEAIDPPSADRGALISLALDRTAGVYSLAEEASGEPAEGSHLREESDPGTEEDLSWEG